MAASQASNTAYSKSPPTVVLVGDPKQLPATVVSRKAERSGFGRSLLERLTDQAQASFAAVSPPPVAPSSVSSDASALQKGTGSMLHSGQWDLGHFTVLKE